MDVVKEIAAECTPLPSGPTDSFFENTRKKGGGDAALPSLNPPLVRTFGNFCNVLTTD